MGCLLVLVLGGLTAASILLLGVPPWSLAVLAVLWAAAIVLAALRGHQGFGNRGNTDLMLVVAGAVIALALVVPRYVQSKPEPQVRAFLDRFAEAERIHFSKHYSYTTDPAALALPGHPDIDLVIVRGDAFGFVGVATHRLLTDNTGRPRAYIWDSSRGGLLR